MYCWCRSSPIPWQGVWRCYGCIRCRRRSWPANRPAFSTGSSPASSRPRPTERLGRELAGRITAGGYPPALARSEGTAAGELASRLRGRPRPARRPGLGAHPCIGRIAPAAGARCRRDRPALQPRRPGVAVRLEPADDPRLRDATGAGLSSGTTAAVAQQPPEPAGEDAQAALRRHGSRLRPARRHRHRPHGRPDVVGTASRDLRVSGAAATGGRA